MATRKSDNSGAGDPALPQKKKARRRLIGALAVCIAAAIVLPLVLDSEPRRVRDEIQVQIPSRDTPLADPLPGGRDAAAGVASVAKPDVAPEGGRSEPAPAVSPSPDAAKASPAPKVDAKADAKPDAKASARHEAPLPDDKLSKLIESRTASGQDAPAADAPAAKSADAPVKAEDKPAPKSADKPPAKGGYQLQLGAFSDTKGAQRMIAWARKAGVPTHTEKVTTSKGERIRVRAGPFATRAEAERAKAKLAQSHVESTLVAP